jgi:hypothetical protein
MADIDMRLFRLKMQPASFSTVTLDDGKVVFESRF